MREIEREREREMASKSEICTGRILSARPVDLPARGPEFQFRARPVSARGMAKPGPARLGPVRPNKAVSMGFLETIQFN